MQVLKSSCSKILRTDVTDSLNKCFWFFNYLQEELVLKLVKNRVAAGLESRENWESCVNFTYRGKTGILCVTEKIYFWLPYEGSHPQTLSRGRTTLAENIAGVKNWPSRNYRESKTAIGNYRGNKRPSEIVLGIKWTSENIVGENGPRSRLRK